MVMKYLFIGMYRENLFLNCETIKVYDLPAYKEDPLVIPNILACLCLFIVFLTPAIYRWTNNLYLMLLVCFVSLICGFLSTILLQRKRDEYFDGLLSEKNILRRTYIIPEEAQKRIRAIYRKHLIKTYLSLLGFYLIVIGESAVCIDMVFVDGITGYLPLLGVFFPVPILFNISYGLKPIATTIYYFKYKRVYR